MRGGLATAGSEECLKDCGGFAGEDAGYHLDLVIEAGVGAEAEEGVDGAGFGVGAAVDEAREAGLDDGARAHGAGFEGDVEGAVEEAPALEGFAGLAQGDDFGVGGGIVVGFAAVEAAADDARGFAGRVMDNESADGDFARSGGLAGEDKSVGHPARIILQGVGRHLVLVVGKVPPTGFEPVLPP